MSLFFVISAFTLCHSANSRTNEVSPYRNYYIRRFFRIAPLFYLWMMLTYFRDIILWDQYTPLKEILRSLFFVFNLSPAHAEGYVWASWTIGVEMLFYALFPVFLNWLTTTKKALAGVLASILLALLWHHTLLWLHSQFGPNSSTVHVENYYHMSFLHQLPVFIMGILIYRIHSAIKSRSIESKMYVGCLVTFAVLHFILAYLSPQFSVDDKFYIQATAYCFLAVGLIHLPLRIMVNRVSVFLGEISYSVYLTHATAILLLQRYFDMIRVSGENSNITFYSATLITYAVIVPISYGTYKMIEEPGTRIGKNLILKFSP